MGKMKNIDKPIFAIDFEGSKRIGIVEYGAVRVFGGEIVGCRTRICAPKRRFSAADAEFFGISNERASALPPFSADVEEFCRMRRVGVFAAHNAVAEDSMLRDCMPLAPAAENPLTGEVCATWSPFVDTCVLAKKLFGFESAKLSDVVDGLELDAALQAAAERFCPPDRRKWHCALFDALASALILIKICSFDGFEDVSLRWLLKFSKTSASAQPTLL